MTDDTLRLHRAPAERVYRAFLDPDPMIERLPPHGFTGKAHALDAGVGDSHKTSFTNFSMGKSHSFGGRCLELKPVSAGTEVSIVQEGIPAEACYLGWQESLALLARFAEASIPD